MNLLNAIAAAAVIGTSTIDAQSANAGVTMSASYCRASMAVFKYQQYLDGGAPKSFAIREGIYPYHDGTVKCEYEMRATFRNYPMPVAYPNQMPL
jgi:hypothetical protein